MRAGCATVWSARRRRWAGEQDDEGEWTAPQMASRPDDPPYLRRGTGIAMAFKNIGFSFGYQENAWAGVELHGGAEIERVEAYAASAEVGQGTRTVIRQMFAEVLDVDLAIVDLRPMDTAVTGSSGSVSASRMTYMIGNAIRGAAEAALEKWRAEERPAKAEFTYLAPKTTQIDPETGYGHPNFAYGYVAIGAQVEVDVQTGLFRTPLHRLRQRRGTGDQPQIGRGTDRGRRCPSVRLGHDRALRTARRDTPHAIPQHLPHADDRGHPGSRGVDPRREP